MTLILCGRRMYLVRLEGDFSWQAQHIVTFWEIAGARNVVFYNTKSSPRSDREGLRSGGCEMTISWSDYLRIILESSFYLRKHFREFPLKSWASRFRGRRSIWWGWTVTLLAPRNGNDVSYVMRIKDAIHFAWQAQYLVSLKGDFTCSAHWKCRFICDADHWWHWFCVAGAVFGEVGGWLFVAGAAHRDILGDSRSAKCCILQYKIVSKIGPGRSPKRRVRDDNFMVGLSSDYPRIILESSFYRRKHFREFPLKSWASRFRGRRSIWWGSEGDFTCSTHWKWHFICDADQGWDSFCVAGAVFAEFEGWLYLLRALEMSLHMSRGSMMRIILRGRRSIWWSWMVPLVVPRIVNDVSKKYRSSTM